jgi:hypothetical protein
VASWAILSGKWAGRTLYGCTRCAATGMSHFVHLKKRCTGQAIGHRTWMGKQLQEGRHPNGKDLVARIPGLRCMGKGRRAAGRLRGPTPSQLGSMRPGQGVPVCKDHSEGLSQGHGGWTAEPRAGSSTDRDPGRDQSRIDPRGPEWSSVGEGMHNGPPTHRDPGRDQSRIDPFGPEWSPVGEGELDESAEAGAGCTGAWDEPPDWEC